MKILLTHISNTFNYGSAMMAIILIHGIHTSINEKVEFYIESSTEENVNRLIASTGIDSIYAYNYPIDEQWQKLSKMGKIIHLVPKVLRFKGQFDQIIRKFDACIILGGDDYSEYYGTSSLAIELSKVHYLSKKMKVILAGQTMGPFTSYRTNLVKWGLQHCKVYTRDADSYRYLHGEMEMENVILSSDLAFCELPKQSSAIEKKRVLEQYQLIGERYITIVPSGLISSYTTATDKYLLSFMDLIKKLCNEKEKGYEKVVLLAHVFNRNITENDSFVIGKIMNLLDDETKKQVIVITDKILPYEARMVLGNGLFTITGRMHAAVSTFQMQKPALSLSYSVKYAGVIGKGLGMEELIIESANDELWTSGHFADQILGKVEYMVSHYNELQTKIKENTKNAELLATKQVTSIVSQLEGKSTCRKS